jgi:ribosomal protein L24E
MEPWCRWCGEYIEPGTDVVDVMNNHMGHCIEKWLNDKGTSLRAVVKDKPNLKQWLKEQGLNLRALD